MIPKRHVRGAPVTIHTGRPDMPTYTYQTLVGEGNGSLSVGLFNSSRTKKQTITVADNNFSTGSARLLLGVFTLVNGLDYLVGAGVNDTATNLAAALNALPGITAAADAAEVTVTLPLTIGEEDFRVEYLGTVRNFTLSPDTGFTGYDEIPVDPPSF